MSASFDASPVLAQLFDFQRRTAEHAFDRLYRDRDSTRRYLVADETGLGKTHVARGVIAKTIELLQHDDTVNRIDIVYVCSNADIADQNLRKLAVIGDQRSTPATRLTLLVRQHDLLQPSADAGTKPVTFVSFTPVTSFEFGWQTGKAEERAVLYELLAPHLEVARADATALKRILQGTWPPGCGTCSTAPRSPSCSTSLIPVRRPSTGAPWRSTACTATCRRSWTSTSTTWPKPKDTTPAPTRAYATLRSPHGEQ